MKAKPKKPKREQTPAQTAALQKKREETKMNEDKRQQARQPKNKPPPGKTHDDSHGIHKEHNERLQD